MKRYIIYIVFVMLCCGLAPATSQAQKGKKPSVPAATPPNLNTFNINRWTGNWERRIWQQDATLEIKNVSGNSFMFDMNANNGSLPWVLKGRAYLHDSRTAVFTSPNHTGCKIIMHFISDSDIQVEGSHCEGYGDKRVSYTGKFINSKNLKPVQKQTLVSLHILNTQQDAALRRLVGSWYIGFVNFTHLITGHQPQKKSDNGIRTVSSVLNGSQGHAEYIIMTDQASHIWAAIINGEEIHYFTNNTADKKTLPQPIAQWRLHLPKKYTIVYLK